MNEFEEYKRGFKIGFCYSRSGIVEEYLSADEQLYYLENSYLYNCGYHDAIKFVSKQEKKGINIDQIVLNNEDIKDILRKRVEKMEKKKVKKKTKKR